MQKKEEEQEKKEKGYFQEAEEFYKKYLPAGKTNASASIRKEPIPDTFIRAAIKALQPVQRYNRLKEEGKIVESRCAIGDLVYEVQEAANRIQMYAVTRIEYGKEGIWYGWTIRGENSCYGSVFGFPEKSIGQTVFLTLKDAQNVLDKNKEKKTKQEAKQ